MIYGLGPGMLDIMKFKSEKFACLDAVRQHVSDATSYRWLS